MSSSPEIYLETEKIFNQKGFKRKIETSQWFK